MIYDGKIVFSSLCPLFFGQAEKTVELRWLPRAFQYVQTFAPSDTVHIQFKYADTGKVATLNVHDFNTERILKTVNFTESQLGAFHVYDAWMQLTGVEGGVFFTIQSDTGYIIANTITGTYEDVQMGIIDITDSNDTIALIYYDSENRLGVKFGTYSAENTFTYRVAGGIIPSGYTPINELNIFRDQNQNPSLTYAMPSATDRLVLGNDYGLPWYVIECLNHIFSCDVVTIKGQQWVATEVLKKAGEYMGAQIMEVPIGKKTNNHQQNIAGDIYITNRYGYKITTNNNQNYIL